MREVFYDHGTRGRYRAGCDCAPCRAANAVRERDRREAHRVDDAIRALVRHRDRISDDHRAQLAELLAGSP
jgi:hypothetical protein